MRRTQAVTRGVKTVWIFRWSPFSRCRRRSRPIAMELHRMALWQVVRACVADTKLTGTPFPCLEVDLSGGEERGAVVLRPPLSDDTILCPDAKDHRS